MDTETRIVTTKRLRGEEFGGAADLAD